MADFDKGGTVRKLQRTYLGPSIGWVETPSPGILLVAAAGTYNVDLGTTLVYINTTGAVTLNLPSTRDPVAVAGAVPGPFVKSVLYITDMSGAPNVTIGPAAGQNIMNLTSVTFNTAFASLALRPNNETNGWVQG